MTGRIPTNTMSETKQFSYQMLRRNIGLRRHLSRCAEIARVGMVDHTAVDEGQRQLAEPNILSQGVARAIAFRDQMAREVIVKVRGSYAGDSNRPLPEEVLRIALD